MPLRALFNVCWDMPLDAARDLKSFSQEEYPCLFWPHLADHAGEAMNTPKANAKTKTMLINRKIPMKYMTPTPLF